MNRALLCTLVLLVTSGCIIRSMVAPMPAGVRATKDLRYYDGPDWDSEKNRLDVFSPPDPGPHPVVLFVHGGGWVFGDRQWIGDPYGKIAGRLARKGIVTAVISYRLAPKYHHPAQIQDVARATAWMLRHAAEYGGDPNRFFLMGHSAGAQLVALAATDPKWLAAEGVRTDQIAGVIAISGPYEVARLGRTLGGLVMVVPTFGSSHQVWDDVSPASHLEDGKPPPFLVADADGDPPYLRRCADDFADALGHAGVPYRRVEVEWRDHFTDITDFALGADPLGEAAVSFVYRPPARGATAVSVGKALPSDVWSSVAF